MNWIQKLVIVLFLFSLAFIVNPNEAKAVELDLDDPLGNIYFTQSIGDDYYIEYVKEYFEDGNTKIYCIEPGVDITTNSYNETTSWSVTGLSSAKKRELELIAYYGYQYPGHNTARYYAATQELIWYAIIPYPEQKINWYSNSSFTTKLDLSKEKNEINKLIKEHETVPSFVNSTVIGRVGDEIVITDTNGVLSDYKVSGASKNSVSVSGNKMTIKLSDTAGTEKITLKRKVSNPGETVVYYAGSSQKLAYLTLDGDEEEYSFNIQSFKNYVPEIPEKSVSTDKIQLNQDFEYHISHTVNLDDSGLHLKSYTFTDVLEDCLEVAKVTVTNEENEDVTELFDYVLDGQKVTLAAKDLDDDNFYGHTYTFNITVHTKQGYDMSAYKQGDTYVIPNVGQIETDGTIVSTNEVDVTYTPEKVVVPSTAASIPLIILGAGLVLVAGGVAGYYYVLNRKKIKK